MSALLGIWIASLVGAVLFFGTDFFLARSGTKGSLEQVRFQAQQTSSEQQQRARALESNLAQLHMHYEEERLRASQLTERLQAGAARAEALTHAQAECRRLEGELQALKQELSRAEPLGQDIGLLKHQVATLSRARSESEQRADARTREVADLKRKLALATNASTEWKGIVPPNQDITNIPSASWSGVGGVKSTDGRRRFGTFGRSECGFSHVLGGHTTVYVSCNRPGHPLP
jgi:septal ring factor EnvC (AmiA/AmiB activator)